MQHCLNSEPKRIQVPLSNRGYEVILGGKGIEALGCELKKAGIKEETKILIISNEFYSPVNYGKFLIKRDSSFLDIIKTISKKSNVDYKFTIVEGWQEYQLKNFSANFVR